MAENRGNVSGTNTNMPSGVTKGYVDPNTLKMMNEISAKYKDLIKSSFGTIKGFEDAIKKATENEFKLMEKEAKNEEKWNKALNSVVNKFGMISDEFQLTLDESIKETKLIKKEYAESSEKAKKDFIKQSFKNETSSKQIKYIDNKFAKNNKLAEVNNDYFSQLEKLKSSALDIYGENFENYKEYKRALLNLNDTYSKDMKNAWKEDFKENHKVLGGIADGVKDTFERNKESLQGLLGPLNLFIEPLKGFFGGFGKLFKFAGGGIKHIFGKFTKKSPTATDVMKSGAMGVGALYIGNILQKQFGTTKGEEGGLFSKIKDKLGLTGLTKKEILKKGGSKLLSGAKSFLTVGHGAVAGGAGILAGGALMAKDAKKGVQMAGQGEWSESKVASAMGGLLGGFDSGFKGAFKNMGKWALMGFGIGNIICPIVGGLIGGLIGAAVGGILGWIGGEKISKAMESIGNFFKGIFTKTMDVLKKGWTKTKEFAKLAKDKTIMKSKQVKEAIGTFIASSTKAVSEKMNKLKDFGSSVWSSFKEGTLFTDFIPDLLNKIKDKLFEGFNMLKESPLGKFVQDLFTNISNGMTKFFNENPIGKWMDSYIITPIKNAFSQMGVWFSYIGNAFSEGGITGALSAMTVGMIKKDKTTGLSEFETYKQNFLNVDDAIIRTDGSIIKTNPKDTLVALKNAPLSLNQVREDNTKNLNSSLGDLNNGGLNDKLNSIINVLSKILDKDIQVNLPPQTRGDLDLVMSGAVV